VARHLADPDGRRPGSLRTWFQKRRVEVHFAGVGYSKPRVLLTDLERLLGRRIALDDLATAQAAGHAEHLKNHPHQPGRGRALVHSRWDGHCRRAGCRTKGPDPFCAHAGACIRELPGGGRQGGRVTR
jgi:hypothetical protein